MSDRLFVAACVFMSLLVISVGLHTNDARGAAPAIPAYTTLTHEQGYQVNMSGCMSAVCSTVGDGGVVSGVIPKDAGTMYPQANTRYVLVATGAVRINNGSACNSYTTGAGLVLPSGTMMDDILQTNPDGGTGSLKMVCCAESAGAVFEICPLK